MLSISYSGTTTSAFIAQIHLDKAFEQGIHIGTYYLKKPSMIVCYLIFTIVSFCESIVSDRSLGQR
jgi:hypothetical protein